MILQVRSARPEIMLNGVDFYEQLAPYLLNLVYTDSCDSKKADDLQFQVADRDRKFINEWMPEVGVYLDVTIIAERWFTPFAPALRLPCGRFWIDTVEFDLPAHTVSVKASSIPTGVRLKSADDTRGWDDISLKDLAGQIAQENNMQLEFPEGINNPTYGRIEQHEESALAFLQKRAADAKLGIKVHENKIIFFDEQKMEEESPKFTVVYGDGAAPSPLGAFGSLVQGGFNVGAAGGAVYRMTGAQFTRSIIDKAQALKVKYTRPETGETITQTAQAYAASLMRELPSSVGGGPLPGLGGEGFTPEGGNGASEDIPEVDTNVNENPGDEEEEGGEEGDEPPPTREGNGLGTKWNKEDMTGQLAKAKLRDKNKDKDHGKITLSIGNPMVAAGQTMNLVGVGQFDGKWFVETIEHKVAPEYNTELHIRRCLEGY